MAFQEEKTLLKSHEKPINISHLLDFSPNKLSETEYLVMETLAKSKFAMNTYQIYRAIAEKIILENFDAKEFNKVLVRVIKLPNGLMTVYKLRKMWSNPKDFEKIATVIREVFIIDIHSYKRILRTLESLNELGWIMKRVEATKKKEGAIWFISDEIRKKLQP